MLLIIHHTTQNVFKVFVIYKVYFTKHNLLLTGFFFFLSCLIRELYMEEFVSTLCFQGHLMPIAFQKKM